jgi:hypothetical protein
MMLGLGRQMEEGVAAPPRDWLSGAPAWATGRPLVLNGHGGLPVIWSLVCCGSTVILWPLAVAVAVAVAVWRRSRISLPVTPGRGHGRISYLRFFRL